MPAIMLIMALIFFATGHGVVGGVCVILMALFAWAAKA